MRKLRTMNKSFWLAEILVLAIAGSSGLKTANSVLEDGLEAMGNPCSL